MLIPFDASGAHATQVPSWVRLLVFRHRKSRHGGRRASSISLRPAWRSEQEECICGNGTTRKSLKCCPKITRRTGCRIPSRCPGRLRPAPPRCPQTPAQKHGSCKRKPMTIPFMGAVRCQRNVQHMLRLHVVCLRQDRLFAIAGRRRSPGSDFGRRPTGPRLACWEQKSPAPASNSAETPAQMDLSAARHVSHFCDRTIREHNIKPLFYARMSQINHPAVLVHVGSGAWPPLINRWQSQHALAVWRVMELFVLLSLHL